MRVESMTSVAAELSTARLGGIGVAGCRVTCRDLELTECVVDDDRGARRNDRRQHKSERRAHNLMKSESEGVKANTHR